MRSSAAFDADTPSVYNCLKLTVNLPAPPHTHTCTHTHTPTHTQMQTLIAAAANAGTHTPHTNARARARARPHTHTHAHARTHTHTHRCKPSCPPPPTWAGRCPSSSPSRVSSSGFYTQNCVILHALYDYNIMPYSIILRIIIAEQYNSTILLLYMTVIRHHVRAGFTGAGEKEGEKIL
jgi:hypothetical protein